MMLQVSEEALFSCCACRSFAARVVAAGPFSTVAGLVDAARRVWWQDTSVLGWLEAFAAHPKIGDRVHAASPTNTAEQRAFHAFSESEQAVAGTTSSDDVTSQLSDWNARYAKRYGHIFIICASGRSSAEILAALKARFNNSPYEELSNAAAEQMKITELRFAKLFAGASEAAATAQRRATLMLSHLTPAAGGGSGDAKSAAATAPVTSSSALAVAAAPLRSPITTHVLDTATGLPAEGLPLALLRQDPASGRFEQLTAGTTNHDGRVPDLLPPSNHLAPGRYRMRFDTATYLHQCRRGNEAFYAAVPFYPEVVVEFVTTEEGAADHYHIPLLLSPYGYSTYRGS